jgi:Fe-S-cluster containining protein
MIIIQNVLVSEEIIEEQFLCNLNACKGACCWEGDSGAPLDVEELPILDKIYPIVKPFLTKEGIQVIEKEGAYKYWEEAEEYGTNLVNNGPCVFISYDELGIAKCGIEKAHQAGLIDFKKPISCHLYPIRIRKNEEKDFEALNYDEWEICSAACEAGKKAQLPIYQFVKDAIIRKYGKEFYEELDAAAEYLK